MGRTSSRRSDEAGTSFPARSIGAKIARLLGLVVAAAVTSGVALLPASAPAQAAGTAASVPLGFYTGAAEPSWVTGTAQATGTSPKLAEDFLVGGSGWSGMVSSGSNSWLLGPWQNSGYQMILGVPIIPSSNGTAVGTLATGATGAYDSYYTTLAQTLISYGDANAILRLGWEFNGNWYAWAVNNNTDAANFAAYWRQIVTTMRAVPGANFQYVWNVSDDAGSFTLADAYPGSAYVSSIGVDAYDEHWGAATPQTTWSNLLTATAGLNWAASFAASNDVPVSIPEWGLATDTSGGSVGMGDDPYYINQMAAWIASNNVAFDNYFSFDASDGNHTLSSSLFPNAFAAFEADFKPVTTPPVTTPPVTTPVTITPVSPPNPAGAPDAASTSGSTGNTSPASPSASSTSTDGYLLATAGGQVFNFGDAPSDGSAPASLGHDVVGVAETADGKGYWLATSKGDVINFGDAGSFGTADASPLNRPIVGMAATPDGKGYWLVASDGGIFSFGDAGFYGSTGGEKLNKPIIGMAATPDGKGYWLVASDGGIFSFGDAGYFGSTGGEKLNKPILGMAATPDGNGYWLVASDGGIFTFGDAGFYGSTGGEKLNKPITGMAATPDGNGYWLVASDGGIFTFGDAGYFGSTGAMALSTPIVGMA